MISPVKSVKDGKNLKFYSASCKEQSEQAGARLTWNKASWPDEGDLFNNKDTEPWGKASWPVEK